MAFCTKCGITLPSGAKLCPDCGTQCDEIECSNRGEMLDALAIECDACGCELRGNKGLTSVQEFSKGIKQIEADGGKGYNRRIATYISTFPIPSSREELLELFVLSASNIDPKVYGLGGLGMSYAKKSISYAYRAKFEQAYRKAQTIFGSGPAVSDFSAIYSQKKKEVIAAKRNLVLAIAVILLYFFAFVFGMLSGKFGFCIVN